MFSISVRAIGHSVVIVDIADEEYPLLLHDSLEFRIASLVEQKGTIAVLGASVEQEKGKGGVGWVPLMLCRLAAIDFWVFATNAVPAAIDLGPAEWQ